MDLSDKVRICKVTEGFTMRRIYMWNIRNIYKVGFTYGTSETFTR
jgi:hypothetical protein